MSQRCSKLVGGALRWIEARASRAFLSRAPLLVAAYAYAFALVSSAKGVAPGVPPRSEPNTSVSRPRNRFIALKVVCGVPVADSPEACVSPAGERFARATGRLPVRLKTLVRALATFC